MPIISTCCFPWVWLRCADYWWCWPWNAGKEIEIIENTCGIAYLESFRTVVYCAAIARRGLYTYRNEWYGGSGQGFIEQTLQKCVTWWSLFAKKLFFALWRVVTNNISDTDAFNCILWKLKLTFKKMGWYLLAELK